jgi:hypothetical protein
MIQRHDGITKHDAAMLGRRNDDGESKRAREDKRTDTKHWIQRSDNEPNVDTEENEREREKTESH